MRDFNTEALRRLFESSISGGYRAVTYHDFITGGNETDRLLVLRHDVDARPGNALSMAELENKLNLRASYYFRDTPKTFKPGIVSAIAAFGHEIGYHYENMSKCGGDIKKAFDDFNRSLAKFRRIVEVKTICSHGRPLSGYDNLSLWDQYDYKKSGILADINCDTDFSNILYLTDTGRSWNSKFNRRDKVRSSLKCDVRSTSQLVRLFNSGSLPAKIILNIHPQRWTDNYFMWYKDKYSQAVRNSIKYFFFMQNGNGIYPGK